MSNAINTVMLVDDSQIEHEILTYILEDYGSAIKLISAFDGQEALDLLASHGTMPDLIFLDINMPRLDGHGFLAEFQRREDNCPVVVMLTSSDNDRDKSKCEAYDFVKDYIAKPLELETFEKVASMVA